LSFWSFQPWRLGQKVTIPDLNKLVEEIKRLGRITASAPLTINSNQAGIQIGSLGGDGSNGRLCKAKAQINKGAVGNCTLWILPSGAEQGEEENAGEDFEFEAYARYGTVLANRWAVAFKINGLWEVMQTEC
jgi:hypothetical protein